MNQVINPSHGFISLRNPLEIMKKYPCQKCTSVFSRKSGLAYHEKFECSQPPRFCCPYCTYRARHVSNTRKHVKRCHPGEEIQAIDICQFIT